MRSYGIMRVIVQKVIKTIYRCKAVEASGCGEWVKTTGSVGLAIASMSRPSEVVQDKEATGASNVVAVCLAHLHAIVLAIQQDLVHLDSAVRQHDSKW